LAIPNNLGYVLEKGVGRKEEVTTLKRLVVLNQKCAHRVAKGASSFELNKTCGNRKRGVKSFG